MTIKAAKENKGKMPENERPKYKFCIKPDVIKIQEKNDIEDLKTELKND